MSTTSYAILGGDLRQCYLAEYIGKKGHEVTCLGTSPFSFSSPNIIQVNTLKDALDSAHFVLCPTPFCKNANVLNAPALMPSQIDFSELLAHLSPGQQLIGGGIPLDFLHSCNRKQVVVWDIMNSASFLDFNAKLTAEGLLATLIETTPFSLTGRRLLLLGYGHCGAEIAKRLLSFDMDIFAIDNQKERCMIAGNDGISASELCPDSNTLSSFDIVINTIPASVLSFEQLSQLPNHCIFFDIASSPFGISQELALELKLNYLRCPGIPGNKMPQTAGEYIGKVILERTLFYET